MPEETRKRFWIDWHTLERIQAVFDLAVVIFSGGLWWTSCQQWQSMKDQKEVMQGQLRQMIVASGQTDKIITEATKQSKAASDAATAAQQALTINQAATTKTLQQGRAALDASIKSSQIDQRAWIAALWEAPQFPVRDGVLTGAIEISNSGKTPALNVSGSVAMTFISPGWTLDFSHPEPSLQTAVKLGAVFPGSSMSVKINPMLRVENGQITTGPLSPTFLKDGRGYIVMFGKLSYSDTFGVEHWLTFCRSDNGLPGGMFGVNGCAEYNGIDHNQ